MKHKKLPVLTATIKWLCKSFLIESDLISIAGVNHRMRFSFFGHVFSDVSKRRKQGLREGGSGGTSYLGPGLGEAGLKGPRRVQVSALSFGIPP